MNGIEEDFMQFLSGMTKVFGTQDLMLKVFALLFIEPEEIAMDDIAKKTGYSLASISNTMKMLENIGGIKRIHKP
jgi:DNA-binding transcriptional regulator GbsR (MarR family)